MTHFLHTHHIYQALLPFAARDRNQFPHIFRTGIALMNFLYILFHLRLDYWTCLLCSAGQLPGSLSCRGSPLFRHSPITDISHGRQYYYISHTVRLSTKLLIVDKDEDHKLSRLWRFHRNRLLTSILSSSFECPHHRFVSRLTKVTTDPMVCRVRSLLVWRKWTPYEWAARKQFLVDKPYFSYFFLSLTSVHQSFEIQKQTFLFLFIFTLEMLIYFLPFLQLWNFLNSIFSLNSVH